MSKSTVLQITCPGCGRIQEWTSWLSVNATLDPALKARLLSRDLTRFTCGHCGRQAQVDQQLLYHDMEKKLLVWLLPEEQPIADPKEVAGTAELFEIMKRRYSFRRVGQLHELVEKVLLFDAKLDDRIMEVFKHLMRDNLAKQHGRGGEGRLLYRGGEPDNEPSGRLAFTWKTAEGELPLEVETKAYRKLEREVRGNLPPVELTRGQWLRIDEEFAKERMKAEG